MAGQAAPGGEPVAARDADGLRCLLILIGGGVQPDQRWRERVGELEWVSESLWFEDEEERFEVPAAVASRLCRVSPGAPAAGRADVWAMVMGDLPRGGGSTSAAP